MENFTNYKDLISFVMEDCCGYNSDQYYFDDGSYILNFNYGQTEEEEDDGYGNRRLTRNNVYFDNNKIGTLYFKYVLYLDSLLQKLFRTKIETVYADGIEVSFDQCEVESIKKSNIINLYMSGCEITEIPALPDKLRYLLINNNKIERLPKLPRTIDTLQMNNNPIDRLPKLPTSLRILYINDTNIEEFSMSNLYSVTCNGSRVSNFKNISQFLSSMQFANTPFQKKLQETVDLPQYKGGKLPHGLSPVKRRATANSTSELQKLVNFVYPNQ